MRTVCGILLVLAGCATGARAADPEFAAIVRAISSEYHAQPMHIPLFGLVKTVTFVARPAGAKSLDLAVFEDLDTEGHDAAGLARRISQIAGASWKPFVQVRSNRAGNNETVLVFMRWEKADAHLLVTAIESHEATVVHVKLKPAELRRWAENPAGEASNLGAITDQDTER